jgi:hypothetical protein
MRSVMLTVSQSLFVAASLVKSGKPDETRGCFKKQG